MSIVLYRRATALAIGLVTLVLFAFQNTHTDQISKLEWIERRLHDIEPPKKELYNATAIQFLREYGLHYHLFDQFFFHGKIRSGSIKQITGVIQRTNSIAEEYSVRDYSTFKTWGVATATVRPEYANLRFTYNPPASSEEMMLYNNRFRYGPAVNDRFMWIGFDRDPWTESTAAAPAKVFFAGYYSELPANYSYTCSFHSPTGKTFNSTSAVIRKIPDAMVRTSANTIVHCVIPAQLIAALVEHGETEEIVLDFYRTLVPWIQRTPQDAQAQWMLRDIHVPRQHPLNRRKFKHVLQAMVVELDDVMILEWMVYNIMLGVEHFYLYYNAKSTDVDIERSILRPFLDANIVTLIYFPFLHTVRYHLIQQVAMNVYLQGYGIYTEWVGYWDIDEFFLPGSGFRPELQKPPANYTTPMLPLVTAKLAPNKEPAIMFDTLDMDCAENHTNFYNGGNNLILVPGTQQAAAQPDRYAVTTHCTRVGAFFMELKNGHGKMLIRTASVQFVPSPHRYNHFYTIWTTAKDGWFRHFNRFRNTVWAIKEGTFTADKIFHDTGLRNFTIASLRELVGIVYEEAEGKEAVQARPQPVDKSEEQTQKFVEQKLTEKQLLLREMKEQQHQKLRTHNHMEQRHHTRPAGNGR